jgi:hypothetical protein
MSLWMQGRSRGVAPRRCRPARGREPHRLGGARLHGRESTRIIAAVFPSAEALATLDVDPAAARVRFAAHRDDAPSEPMRLAYEMAAWASGGAGATYPEHLRVMGIALADAGVLAAHLGLARVAAEAELAGPAAFWLGAWLKGSSPHPLSDDEIAAVLAVHRALVAVDSERTGSLVRAVLRVDPEARELVEEHVGGFLAADVVAFLREHRGARWVAAIARELPELATFGDLADAATRALLVDAMVELGGVSRDEASRSLTGPAGESDRGAEGT